MVGTLSILQDLNIFSFWYSDTNPHILLSWNIFILKVFSFIRIHYKLPLTQYWIFNNSGSILLITIYVKIKENPLPSRPAMFSKSLQIYNNNNALKNFYSVTWHLSNTSMPNLATETLVWWSSDLIFIRSYIYRMFLQISYIKFWDLKSCPSWILTENYTTLQTHHVDSTSKWCGNGHFHVVSTRNRRGVFVGN